jgi:hypothetical protein
MANGFLRVIPATLVAVMLAAAGVLAQAKPGTNPNLAPQPVGTLTVEGIAETPTAIFSFGFDVTNSGSLAGGGGGAGKATFSDIQITRQLDAVSPQLFRTATLGIHLAGAQINVYAPGTTTVQSTYRLTNLLVSGVNNTNGVESVSLRVARVEVTAGGVTTCFDLATNAAC